MHDERQDRYYRFWAQLNLIAQQCWRIGVGDLNGGMGPDVPEGDPAEMAAALRRIAAEMEDEK